MSESITEVSTYSENVVVPETGEAVTAESVKVTAQSLSNRTKLLKDTVHNWHQVALAPLRNDDDRFSWYEDGGGAGPVGLLQTSVASRGHLLLPVDGLPSLGRIAEFAVTLNGAGGSGSHIGLDLTTPEVTLVRYETNLGSANFLQLVTATGTYALVSDYDQRHDIVGDTDGLASPEHAELGEHARWFIKILGESGSDAAANALLIMGVRIRTESPA